MKSKFKIAIILFAVISLSSCRKDDDNSPAPSASLESVITTGIWRVSYFTESGSNHTSDFNGYTFSFSGSKTMTATSSSGTTTGTWRIDDDGSNEFHMTIGNSSPLTSLDRGWQVISQSGTEIRLRDDDASHDEELHFTKI